MNKKQIQASDPMVSSWVSASAGTGKTKILTDRILRLLLKGNDFSKILCLTYTDAGASEMKERISSTLEKLSRLSNLALENEIYRISGERCNSDTIDIAKTLYQKYLNSNEITIQTIHSFSLKLLKRFPQESGISPNFQIIDEVKSHEIIEGIKNQILQKEELDEIYKYLISNIHESNIQDILSGAINNKVKFLESRDSYKNHGKISEIITILNDNFEELYASIHSKLYPDKNLDIENLKKIFLTQKGEKRKKIKHESIEEHYLKEIQDELYSLEQEIRTKKLNLYSDLVFIYCMNIIDEYESFKIKNSLLDYDDFIIYASRLLSISDMREWVLYKLDGGIDHLLIDEAQDTNKYQWQIIDALTTEFYAGESVKEENRTIFIVGDEKQSIFSFQGSDLNSFLKMKKSLKRKMADAKKNFKDISLSFSYRSAKEILDIVHNVFIKIKHNMPELFISPTTKLKVVKDYSGYIELWPLCKSTKNESFWDIETIKTCSSAEELAKKIAHYIKNQLGSKRVLGSTGKRIEASDFMILFRKRGDLMNLVNKSLQENNIYSSGLDRILIKDNIIVLDILSICKFVLNPEDNLNLLALLKSPIIGMTEDEIYKIANSSSIWEYINTHMKPLYEKLHSFLEIYSSSKNFLESILDIYGYREVLNSYSPNSDDIIDQLLSIYKNYTLQNTHSLQDFIFWIENYNESIKRESENKNNVKLMTVHGSKGLQAPIVILCDTTSTPRKSNEKFYWKDNRFFLAKDNFIPDFFSKIKHNRQKEIMSEYFRLLYVAMTRAQENLIVCGYQGRKKIDDDCWYNLIHSTLKPIVHKNKELLTYGRIDQIFAIPTYQEQRNNIIVSNHNKINPKQNIRIDNDAISPLADINPMNYGKIFHKILEDAVNEKNLLIMKDHPLISTLDITEQRRMIQSMKNIIGNNEFTNLIKNQTKCEISLGILDDNITQIRRIDLLIFYKNEIIVIDYKSDKKPMKKLPVEYFEQLMQYKCMVQKIYPDKTIKTMILWLETGSLICI